MAEPPVGEATTTRKDYLKMAYEGLEAGMKKDLQDLRDKFDGDTKKAIQALTAKKSDPATKHILNTLLQPDYEKLSIGEKGDIQRWALSSGKRLDPETIERLSNLSIMHQSRENTPTRAGDDTASVSLDELLMVCGERKEIAEQKKVFKFLDKEVDLKSLWSKLVDTVDKLKSVGDTATSSNQTAGLVWGIFKVLLQFAVLSEKGAEAALSGMQTAANAIQRAAMYEKHLYDPTGRQTLSQREIQPFETCLVFTYQRVFKFFVTANKCFRKNKASLCWYVFWSAGDILEFEKDVFKCEQSLFRDAAIKALIDQASQADLIHDLLQDVSERIMGTQQSTEGVLARQSGIELLINTLTTKIDDIQVLIQTHCPDVTRDQILSWFSAAKVKDHHRAAKDNRTKNTARWILKRPEYQAWSSEPGPSLLWIKGISGAGKTTVVSRLVDKYCEGTKAGEDSAKTQVAYFYCKRDAADRRFSEDIFRSFIRQLASAYHPLPERLIETYRDKSPASSLSTKLYEKDYKALLAELIPRTTETILILDALDECTGSQSQASSDEMNEVLNMFNHLLKKNLPIKIVVASRHDEQIQHSLKGNHIIEISEDDNTSDIGKMVEAQIDKYNAEARKIEIDDTLRDKILDIFYEKSQGKFQWATMQIKQLLDDLRQRILRGRRHVEEMLGRLPKGLADTYDDIIHRINNNLTDDQKETAFRVFKWLLVFGTCDEKVLIAATCQRLEGGPGDLPDPVEGDAGFILTACQHLVIIQASEFRFSHLSVQEYFESRQERLADADHQNVAKEIADTCHYDVAKVCATVFLLYKIPAQAVNHWLYYCNIVNISLPFVRANGRSPNHDPADQLWYFSCRNWYSSFMEISDPSQQEDVRSIIEDSLSSAFTAWLNMKVTDFMMNRSIKPHMDISLRYTSDGPYGFEMWFSNYDREMYLDNPHCMTAMPRDRHEDLPIFSGFPIGSRLLDESLGRTSYNETMSIPHLIDLAICCGILSRLERPFKKDMTDEGRDDPHFHQGKRLLNELFKSILESNPASGKEVTRGSPSRLKSTIETLELEYGSREQDEFLTLCTMFIRWRQMATDWNAMTLGRYEQLFSAAVLKDEQARQCYGELARLMILFLGLDQTRSHLSRELGEFLFKQFPDATTIEYQYLSPLIVFDLDSALATAAVKMDRRYLGILLSHGANIHAVTSDGTLLVAALSSNNIDNAEFLLQEGARMDHVKEVKLNSETGYTNLTIMACSIQERSLFDFLLRHSNIDKAAEADNGECRTPLIAACRFGHVDRVRFLLSEGDDLTRRVIGGSYRNALCAAVRGRSIRVVRQLLDSEPLQLRELKNDGLEEWGHMHHGTPEPDYEHSIGQKCLNLHSWLTLAFLHSLEDPPEEENDEGSGDGGDEDDEDDTADLNSEEDGDMSEQESIDSDQSEDSDDSDQETTSSVHIGDDETHAGECGSNDDDGNEESETNQYEDQDAEEHQDADHYETDRDPDNEADSRPESVVMEQNDVHQGTIPSPEDALRNINNLVSWLHRYCAEDPQGVRRELTQEFGFPISDGTDDATVELVRNALLRGFQNVLHLTLQQGTLDDITETWMHFLSLAEGSLGLPSFYENALRNEDEAGLRNFHRRIGRLENGF